MSKRVSAQQRQTVTQRANGCCEYCQSQVRFATQPFSVEHILPVSKSGGSNLANLALACQGCNNHKYNKTEAIDPVGGKPVPLFHPRQHAWEVHFAWNDDYSLVVGKTAVGRATVETLKLNRESLVNLRQILYAVDQHPPSSST